MKLCAIYNVWSDWVLFNLSYEHHLKYKLFDGVIVVGSIRSNFNESGYYPFPENWVSGNTNCFRLEPDLKSDPRTNETAKRNFGIEKARQLGYTHFVIMDADEFYEPEEFLREKQRMAESDIAGLVCRVKCYFRSPTLTIGYDTTLVPFIHKLTPSIACEFNRNYPFAWTDEDGKPYTAKRRIRIDPTRSLNINSGVEWSDITMHHYSHIRADMRKKIRNSTAKANIERSSLLDDYKNAAPGYFCKFYGKELIECENIFGLPEITDSTI